jgi:AcrR family transcriptional regulator
MNDNDPRVIRTRKQLRDALISLVQEKSFQSISVQDIAERAALNRATFYAHFEDKFALMDHVVRDMFRQDVKKRIGASSSFTFDSLHLLAIAACEFIGRFHGICVPPASNIEPLIESKVQDELHAFLLDWLQHDQTKHASIAEDPEIVATVMSWAIFGAGIQWSRSDRRVSARSWTRQVVTVLLAGAAGAGQDDTAHEMMRRD